MFTTVCSAAVYGLQAYLVRWKWIWQGDYHRFSWWGRWGVR